MRRPEQAKIHKRYKALPPRQRPSLVTELRKQVHYFLYGRGIIVLKICRFHWLIASSGFHAYRIYPDPQNAPDVSPGMNVPNFPEGERPKATDVSPWYGVYSPLSLFLLSVNALSAWRKGQREKDRRQYAEGSRCN